VLKRLVCLVWGHRPWRVVAETVHCRFTCPDTTTDLKINIENTLLLQRAILGGKTITLACDRCGDIRTIEH
jgi:hypothetical protein